MNMHCVITASESVKNLFLSCPISSYLVNDDPSVIIKPHRSTTYADVAYCYRQSSMVCLSVVSPAKTAELIEMLFQLRTWWVQGTMY